MLELYYNFFDKFCDVQKFEELEMDTDFLYLALAHENLHECIKPEMRIVWNEMRSNDCTVSPQVNFLQELVATNI